MVAITVDQLAGLTVFPLDVLTVYHRIKDDRMENSINGSQYRHNLR